MSSGSGPSGRSVEAANFTYLGLHALQHRGQESAGIVSTDGQALHVHRGMGLVADIFTAQVLDKLPGGAAIGHVRYSTAGREPPQERPAHRRRVRGRRGGGGPQRQPGQRRRAARPSSRRRAPSSRPRATPRCIVHLMARARTEHARRRRAPRAGAPEALCARSQGAYASLLPHRAARSSRVRDPHGFRPLVLGRLQGPATCSPARPPRSTSSRPSTCARSSRASWW